MASVHAYLSNEFGVESSTTGRPEIGGQWCIRRRWGKGYDGSLMDEFPSPDEHLSRLMARAQQGDSDAYVTLLRAITPRIRQLVRAKRGFLAERVVEDVVQEVLLSVHTVRATYDPARPLMPWLSAIVRHRLADAGRRHVRQGAHEIGVDDLDVTSQAPAANSREEMFGDPDALAQAIQALPPGQRQAVELLKLRELSLKEASALTGMSIGALKIATHRALASLRRALQGTDDE
jgi:RNA polymerase sigma-70 factor, ECF subfamily